jgi:hypothetical protein
MNTGAQRQTITVPLHYMPEIAPDATTAVSTSTRWAWCGEMPTGQVLFFGNSPAEVLMKHMSRPADLAGIDELSHGSSARRWPRSAERRDRRRWSRMSSCRAHPQQRFAVSPEFVDHRREPGQEDHPQPGQLPRRRNAQTGSARFGASGPRPCRKPAGAELHPTWSTTR